MLEVGRKVFEGGVGIDAEFFADLFEGGTAEGCEGQANVIFEDRQEVHEACIHIDQAVKVEIFQFAKPIAGLTCALWSIEGEQPWLHFGDRYPVRGAAPSGRKNLMVVVDQHGDQAIRFGQGHFNRLDEAPPSVGSRLQPINHQLDGVLFIAGQLNVFFEASQFSIDSCPNEAFLEGFSQFFSVLAFSAPDDGCHDVQARVRVIGENVVGYLRGGEGGDLCVANGAPWCAQTCHEQTQMVENLGDGTHGAARVSVHRFLVDAQGWAEAIDAIHPWFFHLAQELPGIARQRLHETPLAFLVDGIEGQGRLATAAQSGDHHKLIPRDVDVDVLQVVFRCALDADMVHRFPRVGLYGRAACVSVLPLQFHGFCMLLNGGSDGKETQPPICCTLRGGQIPRARGDGFAGDGDAGGGDARADGGRP